MDTASSFGLHEIALLAFGFIGWVGFYLRMRLDDREEERHRREWEAFCQRCVSGEQDSYDVSHADTVYLP